MTSTINASTTAGLVSTADTSGVLELQTAGTTAVSISASQVVTLTNALAEASGGTGTTVGYNGFKNRIINGAMTIAQYGTTTTLVTGNSNGFAADRFRGFNIGDGACSIIQATNAPPSTNGFINSVQIDVTTADTSIAAGELYMIRQVIEGLNITDLAWGTANAKTITLSFWVSSPKTGTHFVAFKNNAQDRAYAASYTVSVADTWEFKTITVAGDQSGTWLTTNGTGIQVCWNLAVGSTFQTATANVWAAGDVYATSAQVNVMDSTANNFYITGVQLEKGSTATSFDYRPYGTELQLAQRYFVNLQTVASPNIELCIPGATTGTTNWTTWMPYPMRAAPTATLATSASVRQAGTTYNVTTWSTAVTGSYPQGFYLYALVASAMTANSAAHFYAYQSVNNFSAEL
jgi:hypothetical protein